MTIFNNKGNRNRETMKRMRRLAFLIFSLTHFLVFLMTANAQVGTWRAYIAYYEPQQIVKGSNQLFVLASNGLYSYNLTDQSITTYDKMTSLSDTHVNLIAWNTAASRLIIVYDNSNIDLMDQNGRVTNISGLYSKSMTQDKTVNSIYINGVYAYLATGFGVVKVNMQRAEIAESYILNENVSAIGIDQTNIYIRTAQGKVLTGELGKNLIDFHNWQTATAPDGIFTVTNTDWDNYIDLVCTLQPGGPKSNHFGFMTHQHDLLYTSSGNTYAGCIQTLKDYEWTIYQDTNLSEISGLQNYSTIRALAIDPKNPAHVFAGARNGLYEFLDGQLVMQHNSTNSPIEMFDGKSQEYQMITGAICDADGNLWCLNSQAPTVSLLKLNIQTKEWTAIDLPELMALNDGSFKNKSLGLLTGMMIDSNGIIWFINDHHQLDSFYGFDPKQEKIIVSFKTFSNQDGIAYTDYRPHCIAEDLDGNIWVGTKDGPFLLNQANTYTQDTYLTQVKVPRNDGSNYADYLLSGVNISCMAVDKGNRKWFGTSESGVYLISADNMEQIQHFTASNSPLLSDNIESIAINDQTGEVFFGTDCGLCSYVSDATESSVEMDQDHVYAYPNPVQPGYDGLISIVGLSFNADVKILSASGQLVAEGRSNGGTFTWNGRDRSGRRVASGIYMVAAATQEGKKGTVCKIAIVR